MVVANNLRAWRRARMLTQAALARLSGVHLVTISLLETSKREARFSTIAKLADALRCAPEALFPGLAIMPSPDSINVATAEGVVDRRVPETPADSDRRIA